MKITFDNVTYTITNKALVIAKYDTYQEFQEALSHLVKLVTQLQLEGLD